MSAKFLTVLYFFDFSTILQIGDIDVNVRDADGWTPLHAAVHWGSQTATELLTEAGADFDLKNNNVRFELLILMYHMIYFGDEIIKN